MSDYQTNSTNDLPLFRNTDPPASKQAAERVVHSAKSAAVRMLKVFREATDIGFALTANEAAELCKVRHGGRSETYRKRARELCTIGHLIERGERQCEETKYNAQTYMASDNSL